MAYTYDELHKKTVEDLRDIAKGTGHEAVQGYTQMNKEHLLPALCKALGIEPRAHRPAAVAVDKSGVKSKLRQLRAERDKALAAHDGERLKQIRRERHRLNRRLRSASV
jgi:hypothetical protein